MRAAVLASAALVGVAAHTPAVSAQEWRAEARAGELRYDAGPGLETTSALLALGYRDLQTTFTLSGGVPLQESDPLWAAVSASRRLTFDGGPLEWGVDLRGEAMGQRDRVGQAPEDDGGLLGGLPARRRPIPQEPLSGWGASAEAMPRVGLEAGAFGAEIRAGGAVYGSEFADARLDRSIVQTDGRLHLQPTTTSLLALSGRRVWADDETWTWTGVSAVVVEGPVRVWGTVGSWLEDEIEGVPWGAGVSVDVTDRIALTATARRDVFDPLYLTPERTSWGVGLSVALDRPPEPARPVPETYQDGLATIALPRKAVDGRARGGELRIAGDFTDWQPVPMEGDGDVWRYTVRLDPGVYNYAFVAPDGTFFVPESVAGRKDDGFGGHVAVLVVEGS